MPIGLYYIGILHPNARTVEWRNKTLHPARHTAGMTEYCSYINLLNEQTDITTYPRNQKLKTINNFIAVEIS